MEEEASEPKLEATSTVQEADEKVVDALVQVADENENSQNNSQNPIHSVDSVEKVPPLGGSELEEDAATVEN